MRIIITAGLGMLTFGAFAQQQTFNIINVSNIQAQSISNLGNSNFAGNILNNDNRTNVVQRQRTNVIKARQTTNFSQVKASNPVKTSANAQARRRARPRTVQVINNNVANNDKLFASGDINAPAQNFILANNINIQAPAVSTNFDNSGSNPYVQQQASEPITQTNFNIDLSLNLKGRSVMRSASSSGSSASHSRAHIFSKKFARFKRHFFGKITSHKKSKHRLDVCFNWKK